MLFSVCECSHCKLCISVIVPLFCVLYDSLYLQQGCPTILEQMPQPLLWTGSRATYGKSTSGTPNDSSPYCLRCNIIHMI